jgi:hypothetical protein
MSSVSLPPLSPPPPTTSSSSQPRSPIPTTQRTSEARAAFTASLTAVGASLSADLTARARNIHQNAAALDAQDKKLKASTKALARDNEALERFLRKSGADGKGKGAMSEFDDLEGLLVGLEGELDFLEGMLGDVEGGVEGQEGWVRGDEQEEAVVGGRTVDSVAEDGNVRTDREGVEDLLEDLHVSDTVKGKRPAV